MNRDGKFGKSLPEISGRRTFRLEGRSRVELNRGVGVLEPGGRAGEHGVKFFEVALAMSWLSLEAVECTLSCMRSTGADLQARY